MSVRIVVLGGVTDVLILSVLPSGIPAPWNKGVGDVKQMGDFANTP